MAPGIHWRKKRKKWYLALLNFCRLLIRKFGAFRWMHPRKGYWGVFIWENSHRREFHTGMTFWFRIAFTWWLSHFVSRYLKVHFMLIKIHAWFKIANITHELPVPVYRRTKFTPKSVVVSLSFRVTWYRCEISYRSEILAPVQQPGWLAPVWHSVVVSCNKCRAMRGNRSELAPARKSLLCHSLPLVSNALVIYFWPCQNHRDHFEILSSSKTD